MKLRQLFRGESRSYARVGTVAAAVVLLLLAWQNAPDTFGSMVAVVIAFFALDEAARQGDDA